MASAALTSSLIALAMVPMSSLSLFISLDSDRRRLVRSSASWASPCTK